GRGEAAMAEFAVHTVELDLPDVAGAFSRRLHDAGVPVTVERTTRFAQALALVEPISRHRLYWTARAVFGSGPSHVKAFDAVFFAVFGARIARDEPAADDMQSAPADPNERPHSDHKTNPVGPVPLGAIASSSPPGGGRELDTDREVAVPMAASDE